MKPLRPPKPEPDWKQRRAKYLRLAGRLAELAAEGLEHYITDQERERRQRRTRLNLYRERAR